VYKLFVYGEDGLTLWALMHHITKILRKVGDTNSPSDCLIFYRPSFGRSGGKDRAEFGEFDAILVSSENIYLIESKWDNLKSFKNGKLTLKKEQKIRHQIFSWYLLHWNEKYFNNWERFIEEQANNFEPKDKKIAPTNTLLATNLESILTIIRKYLEKAPSKLNIKNILLFFYNKKLSTPPEVSDYFLLVDIDYSQEIEGNFIRLA
jgi:hypothetical protein